MLIITDVYVKPSITKKDNSYVSYVQLRYLAVQLVALLTTVLNVM